MIIYEIIFDYSNEEYKKNKAQHIHNHEGNHAGRA